MRASGLHVQSRDGFDEVVAVRAIHLHQLQVEGEPFAFVVLAVKTYDTEWIAQLAARHVADDGAVIVCQNGITDSRVASVVGADRTIGCVVTFAGSLLGPGDVIRADAYSVALRVGALPGASTARVAEAAELLGAVGTTLVTNDLLGERWAKLATNCMVNALSGTTGYSAGEVRSREDTLSVLVQLGAETIRVGQAQGNTIGAVMGMDPQRFIDAASGQAIDALIDDLREVSKATGGHRASMLQDVLKHRRTEIEDLNGFVSRTGREVGVPTPVSDATVAVVKRYPVGQLEPTPDNLVDLVAAAERLRRG